MESWTLKVSNQRAHCAETATPLCHRTRREIMRWEGGANAIHRLTVRVESKNRLGGDMEGSR